MPAWKSTLKTGSAEVAHALGLPRLRLAAESRRGGALPILMYHRVDPDPNRPDLVSSPNIVISEETFTTQMTWLARHTHPLPLADAVHALRHRTPLPPRCVVVTFDDGWADNAEVAWPILRRLGIPCTIYLATSFLDQNRTFPLEEILHLAQAAYQRGLPAGSLPPPLPSREPPPTRLEMAQRIQPLTSGERETLRQTLRERLPDTPFPFAGNRFLTWDQARSLHRDGVHFGAHTVHHPMLPELSPADIATECVASRERIERELGTDCLHFAYPNGAHHPPARQAVHDAGFLSAVTTQPGLNRPGQDLLTLQRINMCERRVTRPDGTPRLALFTAALARLLP